MSRAELQIRSFRPPLELHRVSPGLEMSRSAPAVDVEYRQPQVSYDRADYRAAVGVRTPAELGRQIHEESLQATLDGIGRIAAEGTTLERIENPANSIASVAKGKLPLYQRRIVLNTVPPPVRTTQVDGGVRTQGRPGALHVSAKVQALDIRVTPWALSMDMDVQSRINTTA